MKLLTLKLFNFRQFWGEVSLELAHQGKRSVTIIHGNNGAGKTTLLNAFTWVLYEQFSAAFAPGPLINNRALAEAAAGTRVECWVEVLFEHNSKEYQARRSCYVDKPTDEAAELEESESKLDLKINGKLIKEQEDIEEAIGNVLPGSLHRYLDGGGFPIVMDSPFGSLDSVNRSNIAEAITQLADQLVVLVSKTQWLNEVEQEMQSSIGSEYILDLL